MSTVILCFIIMLILDLGWIHIMKPMYSMMFEQVQKSSLNIRFGGAFFAYLLMFLSLWWIVFPSIDRDVDTREPFTLAVKHAGIMGLLVYGIYNATNFATLQRYSLKVALLDTVWGLIVYSTSVYLALMTSKYMRL